MTGTLVPYNTYIFLLFSHALASGRLPPPQAIEELRLALWRHLCISSAQANLMGKLDDGTAPIRQRLEKE